MIYRFLSVTMDSSAFEVCFLISSGAADARFETTCVRCWENSE